MRPIRSAAIAVLMLVVAAPALAGPLPESQSRQVCIHVVTDRTTGEILNSTTTVTHCTTIDRPRDLPARLRR